MFVRGTIRRIWALVIGLIFGAIGAVQEALPDTLRGLNMPSWFWIGGLFIVAFASAAATYYELRLKYEKPRRPADPEETYVREHILQVSYRVVQPAVHALNAALGAAEAVYMATWTTAADREIVSWAIQGRFVGSTSLSHSASAGAMATIGVGSSKETFASGLFDYLIGRQMLNMVCRLFLTKDTLAGDSAWALVNRDPQKRGCGELMRQWWEADAKLRSEITAMANDAHFSGIKAKLIGHLRDDPRYPNSNFTEALAKFWKVQP